MPSSIERVPLPGRPSSTSLVDLIERVLDKGLVINADIQVSLVGVELLGIKIKAALASFETAARYGLEFPGGTRLDAPGWHDAMVLKDPCPGCGRQVHRGELLEAGCPWCGWQRPRPLEKLPFLEGLKAPRDLLGVEE